MLKNNLFLNFYNFKVVIKSNNEGIVSLLRSDFSYFQTDQFVGDLEIEIKLVESLEGIIPEGLTASSQSINSITYNIKSVRYNDYYNEVITKIDYASNACKIYGHTVERIHEVTYLLILSRQGKWSDLHGLHKIHAMSVSHADKNLIVMMPMKGGKSTLFAKFVEDESFGLISDDTPMVNTKGDILPFPIRFGLEENDRYKDLIARIPDEFKTQLYRKQYGAKNLIDITYFKNRIGVIGTKTILVHGIRRNDKRCIVRPITKIQMFRYMITHMVVGVGLPMVIEYFLETSMLDILRNTKILISRIISCMNTIRKSKSFVVEFGSDIDLNYVTLKKLIL
jgi:hypothetical protein